MVSALICTQADLEEPLSQTLLGKEGVERHQARRLEEALTMVVAARPNIVVVDRDLPRAGKLIAALREDVNTRRVSIAVVASGDFDPGEVELLEAGANAILRLPPSAEWDERLERLLAVPVRKEARFAVHLEMEAMAPGGTERHGALALDLSVHGVLLETAAPLRATDDIALQFKLPGEDTALRAKGRVVRLAAPGRFGVVFTEGDPDVPDRIAEFLKSLDIA